MGPDSSGGDYQDGEGPKGIRGRDRKKKRHREEWWTVVNVDKQRNQKVGTLESTGSRLETLSYDLSVDCESSTSCL